MRWKCNIKSGEECDKMVGNVEGIWEEWLVKRVYLATMESNREGGRLQRRWRDEVKESLMRRGLNEKEGIALRRDRKT